MRETKLLFHKKNLDTSLQVKHPQYELPLEIKMMEIENK